MPNNPKIAVNIAVLNGDKYIERCLNSVLNQSFPHEQIQINILDNGSTDNTRLLIQDLEFRISNYDFPKVNFVMSNINHGMWGGQEELLKRTQSEYVVFLSVDVIIAPDFLTQAVAAFEKDTNLGAIQAKVYQYNIQDLEIRNLKLETGGTIDTCGFEISRSRRIGNMGHGEQDRGQHDNSKEIFGVEGAVPVFRTAALESIRVLGEIADHDLFWYAEDLDVAWRLNLAGWSQRYEPALIAWHDRQTTKRTRTTFRDFLAIRREIPLRKRRLEWRNIRCTIIKNDYIINILRDLPYIAVRELGMFLYLLIFETRVLTELFSLLKFMPRMLKKRQVILSRAKVGPRKIHDYFS